LRKLVVGFGVNLRVAFQFALRPGVIIRAPQVLAFKCRREGSVERQNFQAVPRQIEIADDFRSQ